MIKKQGYQIRAILFFWDARPPALTKIWFGVFDKGLGHGKRIKIE